METTQTIWALGDYHRFATELIWSFGSELVVGCAISPGQRVLDVAAGTGNVAIRAAQEGASVVACDLEPAQCEAGRRQAPPAASSWNGSRPTRRRCRSATASSTS